MADRLTFVHYALNGTGGGHIRRQSVIATALRQLLRALNIEFDIAILTTSDAPQIAHGFKVYKLPSKTSIASDEERRDYIVRSQMLVTSVVTAMRPTVFVMDTAPEGSFNEANLLLNVARRRVFVNRHRDESQQEDPAFQDRLAGYDLLLTPDEANERDRYVLTARNEKHNRFTGVIQGFRPEAAYTREEARRELDVRADEHLVYVSAGAGGDPQAEAELEAMLDALSGQPNLRILVGYGPLYRGRVRFRRNVIAYQGVNVADYFPGVDAAFSAAGYNTYQELLAARVPTAFYAQVKKMDRQDERVQLGCERGWHLSLDEMSPAAITAALSALINPSRREQILASLAARPVSNGAVHAAAEIIDLCTRGTIASVSSSKLMLVTAAALLWPELALERKIRDPNGDAYVRVARLFVQLATGSRVSLQEDPQTQAQLFVKKCEPAAERTTRELLEKTMALLAWCDARGLDFARCQERVRAAIPSAATVDEVIDEVMKG